MTPSPPHARTPEDDDETPDIDVVPRGAVAVFQSPRSVRPGAVPQPSTSDSPAPAPRPDIEPPFLELFGADARRAIGSTVDGTVVETPTNGHREVARRGTPTREAPAPPRRER